MKKFKFTPLHLMHQTSKLQNKNATPKLNGLKNKKQILKATIHCFQMHPRTLKLTKNICNTHPVDAYVGGV